MSDFVKLNKFLATQPSDVSRGTYTSASIGSEGCCIAIAKLSAAGLLSVLWDLNCSISSTLQPQRPLWLPGAIHTVSVCILNKAATVTIGTMDLKYARHLQHIFPIQPQQVSESRSSPGARLYFQTVLTWMMLCFVQPLGI